MQVFVLSSLLLVRPDGYAAWATHVSAPGEQLSAGRAALRHWCGPTIVDSVKSERHGTLWYHPLRTESP